MFRKWKITGFSSGRKTRSLLIFWIRQWVRLHHLTQQKNHHTTIQVSPEVQVSADRELLVRVVVNLLTNASKYTPAGGDISIRVTPATQEGFCQVSVTDTGTGIAPGYLNKVFDRFQQAAPEKSGRVRSTGLGLTFCRLAVQAHNGDIGVESTQGEGATFWFTLPLVGETSVAEVVPEITTIEEKETGFEFTAEELELLAPLVAEIAQQEIYETSIIQGLFKLSGWEQFGYFGVTGKLNWKMPCIR